MNFDLVDFNLTTALYEYGLIALALLGGTLVLCMLGSLLAHGLRGPALVVDQISMLFSQLIRMSATRVGAISNLTILESIRKKALVVFVIFAILFMFAGWFLQDSVAKEDLQVKVFVSFVLKVISWLVLPVMLLLACWGIPTDIKVRSLHTVVTKPVYRNEVFVGRFLGYTLVGTFVLGIMAVAGYFWMLGNIPESSKSQLISRIPKYGTIAFSGRFGSRSDASDKGLNVGYMWDFRSYIEGGTKARTWYTFEDINVSRLKAKIPSDELAEFQKEYETYQEELKQFEERIEKLTAEGGTDSTLSVARLRPKLPKAPTGMLLEHDFEAFRAYKGEISQRLLCRFTLINRTSEQIRLMREDEQDPKTDEQIAEELGMSLEEVARIERELRVPLPIFEVMEFSEKAEDKIVEVPLVIEYTEYDETAGATGTVTRTANLFEDLINEQGELTIEVECMDEGQYLGMARPDLFIRMPDKPFASSYFKSVFGIWLQLVLVVLLGVTASTFVKGPVATFLSFSMLIVGQVFRGFMDRLATGEQSGGGPLESVYRLYQHMNPSQELPQATWVDVMQTIDAGALGFLWAVKFIIPNFEQFRMTEFTANGFDVPWNSSLLPGICLTAAYLIPCFIIGYYSLKNREMEAK